MKNKLKYGSLIIIAIIGLVTFFPISNVNAAYAYSWMIGGEHVGRGSSNKAGTASWVEDATYNGGVLTLNNYNGDQLVLQCNGTGMGHVFAIKLVGENTIRAKGIGIVSDSPIVFIGDGKLTIEANVPMAGTNVTLNGSGPDRKVTIEPKNCTYNCPACEKCPEVTDKQETTDTVVEDNDEEEKEVVEEETTEDNTLDKVLDIITLIYFVVSLALIVSLSTKLNSVVKLPRK